MKAGVTRTKKDMSAIHEAMLEYWGERCPEHEKSCPVCGAWSQYDEVKRVYWLDRVIHITNQAEAENLTNVRDCREG